MKKLEEIAKEKGYFLKIVTSMGLFDNYDMFHNIFEQYEEPCRRLLILTKDENLEEVYEKEIKEYPSKLEDIIYLKEFPINCSYGIIKETEFTLEEIEKIKELI